MAERLHVSARFLRRMRDAIRYAEPYERGIPGRDDCLFCQRGPNRRTRKNLSSKFLR